MRDYIFTSESVSPGHPDKMADQISDAVLDAIIEKTIAEKSNEVENVRVACETLLKTGMVLVAGEVRASVWVDIEALTRQVVCDIGYDNSSFGFSGVDCAVINAIGKQSADIARGVDDTEKEELGAGDQGLMFGYACDETNSLMPLAIHLSHRLVEKHNELRRNGRLPWLRPDAKSQVSVRYQNDTQGKVETVVFSTQHAPEIDGTAVVSHDKRIREAVIEEIIKPVIGVHLSPSCKYHINPTGLFITGGPVADCGLTGRKIIVDTYGGAAPHGGGAFSGKDPTKVDRSASYALRHVAKNVVAAGLARKCLVQAAYAIGVAKPVSLMLNTYGTGKIEDEKIAERVRECFDLTPAGIIRSLSLWQPIYRPTAAFGHFGRDGFPWEEANRIGDLAD